MLFFRLTVTINLQVINSPRSFRSGYFKIAKACTKHEPRDKEAKRRSLTFGFSKKTLGNSFGSFEFHFVGRFNRNLFQFQSSSQNSYHVMCF